MQSNCKTRGLRVASMFFAMVLFVCTSFTPVHAETAAEKYSRLKEELASISGQIESSKNDKNAAVQQKTALEEQKRVVDQLIVINQDEIAKAETDLAAKEEQVAQKRQAIYENDQLFQERLGAIYRMNNSSMLSQLLTVDNFSELLVVSDAMQRISKNDTDLLAKLAKQRKELESEQAQIDQMLIDLQKKYDDLAADAKVLAGNIAASNSRISNAEAALAAQEVAYDETHAALEQAQAEMAAIAAKMGGSKNGDGSQYVGGVFVWPVDGFYNISCQFGSADPNGRGHRGMDIAGGGINGAPVKACGTGTVVNATYAHSSYGNYVIVDHGNGVKTLYAHCSSLAVSNGQAVNQGDVIAYVGSTGFSTGPHLHLEVHDPGLKNPLNYLRG